MGRTIDKKFSEPKRIELLLARGDVYSYWISWLGVYGLISPEGCDEIGIDLRPFPFMETPGNRGIMDLPTLRKAQFMYCVTGWDGLEDGEGNPLPCTDENKEWVFNHDPQIRAGVLREVDLLEQVRGLVLKNS